MVAVAVTWWLVTTDTPQRVLGGHGCATVHGGHGQAMLAMAVQCWQGAWWPWTHPGGMAHGGHGHAAVTMKASLVAMKASLVAMKASWWQGAWWPWVHHGGHGGITMAGHMVPMDVPWRPWTYHGGKVLGGHGHAMVVPPVLRKPPQLVPAPLPWLIPPPTRGQAGHSQTMSR